jgi:hypothetical protein
MRQLFAGLDALEREPPPAIGDGRDPAIPGVSLACALGFVGDYLGDVVDLAGRCPRLAAACRASTA